MVTTLLGEEERKPPVVPYCGKCYFHHEGSATQKREQSGETRRQTSGKYSEVLNSVVRSEPTLGTERSKVTPIRWEGHSRRRGRGHYQSTRPQTKPASAPQPSDLQWRGLKNDRGTTEGYRRLSDMCPSVDTSNSQTATPSSQALSGGGTVLPQQRQARNSKEGEKRHSEGSKEKDTYLLRERECSTETERERNRERDKRHQGIVGDETPGYTYHRNCVGEIARREYTFPSSCSTTRHGATEGERGRSCKKNADGGRWGSRA